MKGNWLTNVLLAACLIVLIGGQISNKNQASIQPARAAEAVMNNSAPLAPTATSGSVSVSAAAFQPTYDGYLFGHITFYGAKIHYHYNAVYLPSVYK